MNLSKLFPISWRATLKKLYPWITLCVSLLVARGTLSIWAQYFDLNHDTQDLINNSLIVCIFLTLAVTVLKGAYHELFRRSCKYVVDGNQLFISKGILLKEQGSFPLSRITDLYMQRSLGDLIFGLCTLQFSTPTQYSAHFARIEGLGNETAAALQSYLATLLEQNSNLNRENGFTFAADGHAYRTIEVPSIQQIDHNESTLH